MSVGSEAARAGRADAVWRGAVGWGVQVTGLTEVTLRKVYKELLIEHDKLIPAVYVPKYGHMMRPTPA